MVYEVTNYQSHFTESPNDTTLNWCFVSGKPLDFIASYKKQNGSVIFHERNFKYGENKLINRHALRMYD